MSFLGIVKNNLTTLPYFLGKPVSLVPYSYRPGVAKIYRKRKKEILLADKLNIVEQKDFVFKRLKGIAVYANQNIPFYTDLYRSLEVKPERFKSFNDIFNLPVITKADLQEVPLDYRSAKVPGRSLVNTGGSSGQPLEFFIEPSSVGHEWAHMHHIWRNLGFKQSDMKVVFGGRSNVRNVIQYDSARHQLNVDLYSGWSKIADRLLEVYNKYSPSYLHGYPSSIFDFILWLDSNRHPLLPLLRNNIKGMFLGSELPSPQLRDTVEAMLCCKAVSWYGHTERAILAYEKEECGIYHPFLTYGFSETVGTNRLVCTSYYNKASPLIRYDTGDLVDPTTNDGFLVKFTISDGREGDFILDRLENKIFLTGLVFGRHHELFAHARHIQIHQPCSGVAEVLVTPKSLLTAEDAAKYFDSTNIDMRFTFRIIDDPFRTPAGKVPLLVKRR